MKYFSTSAIILLFYLSLSSCSNLQNDVPKTATALNIDSIRNDEIKFAIDHGHLVLVQRAVIRPVYVETERNVKAEHKGFMMHAKLKNEAHYVSFHDIKIGIIYYADKSQVAGTEEIRVNKTLKPGQTLTFSAKVKKFRNTSYKVYLASASSKNN